MVLVAVVIHVGEERLRRVVEHAEPRALRHFLEGRVTAGPVEAIGPCGLGDVEVLEPVAIGTPTDTNMGDENIWPTRKTSVYKGADPRRPNGKSRFEWRSYAD